LVMSTFGFFLISIAQFCFSNLNISLVYTAAKQTVNIDLTKELGVIAFKLHESTKKGSKHNTNTICHNIKEFGVPSGWN